MSNDLQGKTTSSGPALNWVQKTKVILSDIWSALEDTTLAMGPGLLYQDDDALTTSSAPKQKGNQIVEWNDLGEIAFGTKLGEPQKTAVRKSGDGPLKYSFTDGAQFPVGDHLLSVYAEATDNYNQSPAAIAKIKVVKAEQKVEWADLGEIVYGTKLGKVHETAKLITGDGPLKYSFTDGSQLDVGDRELSVYAEATDNYNQSPPAIAKVKVVKAEQKVEWADLGEIVYGTKLDNVHKTAKLITGDGPLKYSFTDGSQLDVGDRELSVYAEATDNYNQSPAATAKIKVTKAEQKVEWGANFGEVPFGTKLGESHKTAKRITGEGQLKYSFTDGEQSPVGEHKLSVFAEVTNNYNASPPVTANFKVVAIEEMAKAKKKETVTALKEAIPKEMKGSLGARLTNSDAYTELSTLVKQETWTVETFQQIQEKLEAFKLELESAVKQISELEERQRLAIDKGQKDITRLEDKVKMDLGKSEGGLVLMSEEYLRLQKAMWDAFEIEQNKTDLGLREWMNNVMPRVREVKEFLVGKFKSGEVVDVVDPALRNGTRYELIGGAGKTDVYAHLGSAATLGISDAHRDVYLTAMRQGVISSGSTGSNGTKFEPFGWVVKITISTAKANQGMNNITSPVAAEDRDDAHNAIYLNFNRMIDRH